MNNVPFPYMPVPRVPMNSFPQQIPPMETNTLEEEVVKLQKEIKRIKERLNYLENKEKNDYLKKEDGLYML